MPETITELQIPYDEEAERALLGSIILDSDVLPDVLKIVSDKDCFYRQANQFIYETMLKLYDERIPIEPISLKEELKKIGIYEKCGGAEYIASLMESVHSPANAEYYATLIKEKAILRKLIYICTEITKECYTTPYSPEEILDKAERKIFEVVKHKVVAESLKIGDVLRQTFTLIQDIRDRKSRLTGLPTGLFELDDLLGGLQPSNLIIVAGRPSMGKTSFAMRIIEEVGLKEKKPVLLYSLESDKKQISINILCSHFHISPHLVRKGLIDEATHQKLMLEASKFEDAPIFIDDSASISALELRARTRRMKAEHDIQLVVVDYLQLMETKHIESGRARPQSRAEEIALVSNSLKSLAKELEIPVIAISQLNRDPEKREDHRPRLSDLRESGQIEQDADVVILLHREEYYKENTPKKGVCEVIVAKQRNGPTGIAEVAFLSEFMRFENLKKM